MKSKFFVLGACALALIACNEQKSDASASITPKSTDDQKFAYMLGTQLGEQAFVKVPLQMGEYTNPEAVVQGVRDMIKSTKDSGFEFQIKDSIQAINGRYSVIARNRYEKTRPDSTLMAGRDQKDYGFLVDSLMHALPMKPAVEGLTLPVKVELDAPDNVKFSYLMGLQLGNNFTNISNQFKTDFDAAYFELGIRDAEKAALDSTFIFKVPKDSLDSLSLRYKAKLDSIQEEAIKQHRAEEEKLKAEVAALRGDTLANGMPAKMNPAVKVSGVSYKGDTLGAFLKRPLLVLYFSTTCPHCRHAAPEILAIADEFAKEGLTTLAVASGGNPKRSIRTFIDDLKWDENINVGWDEHRQFGELYSDGYVPKIYLVNPDGSYKLYGSLGSEKDQLKAEIKALLGGKNVEWKIEVPAADSAKTDAPSPAAK